MVPSIGTKALAKRVKPSGLSARVKGDIRARLIQVCSTPNNGHRKTAAARPKNASSRPQLSYTLGLTARGQKFFGDDIWKSRM
jgi:hypothetical protein